MASYNRTNPSQQIDEKRLPIVFLLDVSGSMLFDTPDGGTKLDTMNQFLADFIMCCMNHEKAHLRGDICFVLFTDKIIMQSRFQPINRLNGRLDIETKEPEYAGVEWSEPVTINGNTIRIPRFAISKRDNGTNIGRAVLRGVDLIEQRVRDSGGFPPYPPFLVLVSDGHPVAEGQRTAGDDLNSQKRAIKALRNHEETHRDQCNLIIPLVIPVGLDYNKNRLQEYVAHFEAGYIRYTRSAKNQCLHYVKEIMGCSITDSRTLTNLTDITVSEMHNPS